MTPQQFAKAIEAAVLVERERCAKKILCRTDATESEIDAGAKALRDRMAAKKRTPWDNLPDFRKSKWRDYAAVVLKHQIGHIPERE